MLLVLTAVTADPERVEQVLARFSALGPTLSIDDLGAGHTSLAHLENLPVHQLRIDRPLPADQLDAGFRTTTGRGVTRAPVAG